MAYDRYEPSRRARDRIRAGEGFIYIAAIGGGLIKIGFSLNPEKRVKDRNVGGRARLLATIPGSMYEEIALHKTLRPCRADKKQRCGERYPASILSHEAIPDALRTKALIVHRALEQARYQTDPAWGAQLIERALREAA